MAERANPDTCEHRIARPALPAPVRQYLIVCVSCDATLDEEYLHEFQWTYDIDYDVWRRLTKEEVDYERRLAAAGFRRLVDEIDSSDSGEIIIFPGRVERPQTPTDPGD